MLLPQQIQAILYHFLMGWLYGFCFSFLLIMIKGWRYTWMKGITEIVYHLLFTSLMYYGLFYINGGITNVYLVAFFVISILIYYKYYLPIFLSSFYGVKRWFLPIQKKLHLVKWKIVAIIRLPRKIRRRRKDAKRKKKHKKKKEKASNSNLL